jgi:hypothetical protein
MVDRPQPRGLHDVVDVGGGEPVAPGDAAQDAVQAPDQLGPGVLVALGGAARQARQLDAGLRASSRMVHRSGGGRRGARSSPRRRRRSVIHRPARPPSRPRRLAAEEQIALVQLVQHRMSP